MLRLRCILSDMRGRAKPGPKGNRDDRFSVRLDACTKRRLFRVARSSQPPVSASHVATKLILEGLSRIETEGSEPALAGH